MADEHLLNIKGFMDYAVWSPTWISDGHFAVQKVKVKLGTHLTSTDAVICAYPKAKGVKYMEDSEITEAFRGFNGLRVEFTRSPWQHRTASLFLDASGNAAWFNADYCDALRIESLYGPAPMFSAPKKDEKVAWFNAPTLDDATVVIMPMNVPVDWDQVARTVAAATSLEAEPSASRFTNMPEPPPEEDVGDDHDEDGEGNDAQLALQNEPTEGEGETV